jgi:hypothetical protein
LRIRHAAIAAGGKAAGPAGVETIGQARFEQGTRRALHAQMLWDVPER